MNKRIFFIILMLILLAAGRGIDYGEETKSDCPSDCQFNLIASRMDWRPQDYFDSQGITGVHYDETADCLILECDLKGGDPHKANGEIVLDLKYVPCLEANVPVDMTGRLIQAEIQIPEDFVGPSNAPNGCQVFVKDTEWRSQYGTWENCTKEGIVRAELQPSTETPIWGFTTPGFDPKNIRIIGIKIAINAQSTHQFKGTIKVLNIDVTPPLPFYSAPALPPGQPMPFVTADSEVEIKSDGFYIGDNKWFAGGGNWRLIEYRQNFGATAWFPKGNGISLHPGYVTTKLGWFRQAGVTLVRVGLLDDGASMLDRYGNVVGYDNIFRNDVTTFLNLAAQCHVKVEFALVDFLIAGKEELCNDVWLKGRREVIEDPQVRQKFIKNFLEPFLSEFGDEPVVFGFDIINQPEWIISKADGGGWEDVTDVNNKAETPIPIEQFRNFISECTAKIRQLAPEKFVTVGVSCTNTELLSNLDLDYTAIHYYPWMGNFETNIANAFGNKSWSLEEFPGKGDIYSYFDKVFENGGTGALLWNLSPKIDDQCYKFDDEEGKLQEIRRFVDYIAPVVPTISLSRTELYFGADTSGSVTGSQTLLISNSGTGTLNWTLSDDAIWLNCSPDSGIGTGVVTVSVDPIGLAASTYTGTITVSDPNADNSPQTVTVTLKVNKLGATEMPFGVFATPLNGSTVRSSVPVTGWVLDDLEVKSVKIYRADGTNLIYIGDAIFVIGARPDIEEAFPGYPFNYQAGWGYMLLTNFLPNQGNGAFTLHAVATDIEGNSVTLGTSTIICDNANAVKPFGAIDTPTQGGIASGSNFRNQGWVLTPLPNKIPEDGSTINVYIDGVTLGHPVYNIFRSDIADYFPGYANSDGALAYFDFDTTTYSNGVHTIQWTAADNAGNADGIGSRYFTIQNTGTTSSQHEAIDRYQNKEKYHLKSQISEIPINFSDPIAIKKRFMPQAKIQVIHSDENGIFKIEIPELDHIEIHLNPNFQDLGFIRSIGYLVVGDHLRSLPLGSTFDIEKSIFYWQPGVGFWGNYRFVFLLKHQTGEIEKKIINVRIIQKHGK
jgi:hypothetical protein